MSRLCDRPGAPALISLNVVQPRGRERGAGADRAERGAAGHEVADDDRGPSFGQDLRSPGDRAVLAIAPHVLSVAPASAAAYFCFCPIQRSAGAHGGSEVQLYGRRE